MKMFTMDDLYLTEKLLKVSNSIYNLFNILCDLDIKGKKDNDEYKKNLDYLKIALSVENDLYKNNHLNSDRCNEIIEFIIMSMLPRKMIDDFEALSLFKFDNSTTRRIINALNKKKIMVYDEIGKIFSENEYEDRYIEDLQDILFVNNLIRSYILEDLINAIIVFNEEELQKEENANYRDCLIRMKYFIAYIYKENGEDLLKREFNPYDRILDNTKMYAFATKLNSNDLADIKREFLSKLAIKQIYKILSTNIHEKILIRKSILRASFMLMNDEILFDINEFFTKLINVNDNIYNKDNIELIKMCFINTHNDKNKQITLKLS